MHDVKALSAALRAMLSTSPQCQSGIVTQACHEYSSEIVELRLESYKTAKEFELLQPEALCWNEYDELGVVLVTQEESGRVLSTLRGYVVGDRQDAEQAMGCEIPYDDSIYPSLLLGRAATARIKGGSGFHSLLRLEFLTAASKIGLRSLLGMVYEGAPRTRSMAEMGYSFRTPAKIWDAEVRPLSTVQTAILHHYDFGFAIELLQQTMGNAFPCFSAVTHTRFIV